MLNYLWGFMIIIGVIYGAFTGNVQAVADGAIECAKDAISFGEVQMTFDPEISEWDNPIS